MPTRFPHSKPYTLVAVASLAARMQREYPTTDGSIPQSARPKKSKKRKATSTS
jgi:hypothetical protein